MGFRLTVRSPSPIPLEVDGILPDRVAHLSPSEVAGLPVRYGNRTDPLGAHFDVTPCDRADLLFAGETRNVHGIGRGAAGGTVVVEGSAGRHAGAQMSGGTLSVGGDAGDWLGAELRGGRIEVRGRVGDCAAAAYRGSRKGMTGGCVLIGGDAGHELGVRMRRGMIVVGGGTGEFAGADMIAGTLVVKGRLGRRAGAGMKRGTLMAVGGADELPPGFRFSCEYEPAFLGLLLKSIRVSKVGVVRCYRGDILTGGRGELWVGSG